MAVAPPRGCRHEPPSDPQASRSLVAIYVAVLVDLCGQHPRAGDRAALRTDHRGSQMNPASTSSCRRTLVDSVQIIEDRLLRYNIANMQLQVSGRRDLCRGRVPHLPHLRSAEVPREVRRAICGLAEQRISTRFDAALRQVYGVREFNAALSAERAQMMQRGPRPHPSGYGGTGHRYDRRAHSAHRPHGRCLAADLRAYDRRA